MDAYANPRANAAHAPLLGGGALKAKAAAKHAGDAKAAPAGAQNAALSATLEFALGKLVMNPGELTPAEAERVMHDSIDNWEHHINGGFLEYRKSVAEGRAFAEIEWKDGPDGCTVVSAQGNTYIDCLGGFGCFNVGRSHPRVVGAVTAQLGRMPLHSQELLDPLRGYAAKALCATMPPSHSGRPEDQLAYVFFTNSGTESVEACLKMSVLATGRKCFMALQKAFHGKTLGSLSATSKAAFRGPLVGVIPRTTHLPVNDVYALRCAFESAAFAGELPAALILEPVLGEGGIHVLSPEFMREARRLCTQHGTMLIFDEVQSGMGRSGKWWACEHSGVAPDLMACGKALGGGVVAAGACVGSAKAFAKFFENPFLHTTTFGGSPLACAGVLAALAVTHDEGLPAAAAAKGAWLVERLRALAGRYPGILKEVRGQGLLVGLEFPDDSLGFRWASKVFAGGVLVSGTLVNARVIRVEPPLTITQAQLETVLGVFETAIAAAAAAAATAAWAASRRRRPSPPPPRPPPRPPSVPRAPPRRCPRAARATTPTRTATATAARRCRCSARRPTRAACRRRWPRARARTRRAAAATRAPTAAAAWRARRTATRAARRRTPTRPSCRAAPRTRPRPSARPRARRAARRRSASNEPPHMPPSAPSVDGGA